MTFDDHTGPPSVSHMVSIQTGVNSLRNWFKRRFSVDAVTLDECRIIELGSNINECVHPLGVLGG